MALSITRLDSLYEDGEGAPDAVALDVALRAIAGLDSDGARVRNDVGFNKYDSQFGRRMATIALDDWTFRQADAIYNLLRKYRGQLARDHHIDYDAIEQPVPETWGLVAQIGRSVQLVPTSDGGTRFELTFGRDPALLAVLKEIPGLRWNKDASTKIKSVWFCAATAEAAEMIGEVAPERNFIISPVAEAKIGQLTHGFKAALEASTANNTGPIDGVTLGDITPYPFQWSGPRYVLEHADGRSFIGDERGVGKTLQGLIVLEKANAFPALVVTPNNVKFKWMREIARALPKRKAMLITGRDIGARAKADIYVTNWESLSDGWDPTAYGQRVVLLKPAVGRVAVRKLRGLVLDESHKAKNSGAQRTVAARQIADTMRRDGAFHGYKPVIVNLTGTPVQNRVDELWPQIEILGRGDDFGGYWGFRKTFCMNKVSMNNRPPEEVPELLELNTKLRGICMVRRLKKDVHSEMPPLTRSMIPMEIDNEDEYKRALENAARWFGERAAMDAEFLIAISHLSEDEQVQAKRARAMDAEVRAARGRAFTIIQALKAVAVKGKMAGVREWISEFLDETNGKSLIVFAHHRNVQDELADMVSNEDPALILGGMKDTLRDAENLRFQAKETRVVIGSMTAASEGIDLTAASDTITVELGWNPGHHTQVEGRMDRVGQTEPCTSYYPIALGTIEEDIFELIWESKGKIVGNVTDGADYETFTGRSTDERDDEPSGGNGILNTLARRLAGHASRKKLITAREVHLIEKARNLGSADDLDLDDDETVESEPRLEITRVETPQPQPQPALPQPRLDFVLEAFPDEADELADNDSEPEEDDAVEAAFSF